jgi:hypothetical protein
MKRILFVALAAMMFVACNKEAGSAATQMTDYKEQWVETTALFDAEAVERDGFDAWYNTLTNVEVRNLYAAVDAMNLSYDEAEHWYKNLSDEQQKAARAAAEAWEVENPAQQLQVELFAEIMLGVEFDEVKQKSGEECAMPLLKVYYPKAVKETPEAVVEVVEAPAAEAVEVVEVVNE